MTPFVGLHFIISAILAYVVRANILASAIGTAVGNPWTFPFIWVWIYNVGLWMVGNSHASAADVDFATVFSTSMEALIRFDLAFLAQTSGPVLWPMLVGSIPTALVTWIIFYAPLQPIISRYQTARHHRRTKSRKYKVGDKQEQQLDDDEIADMVTSDGVPEKPGLEESKS